MIDFDSLSHDQQLGILQETAEAATLNYDLPTNVSVEMINLSENATYKIAARDGRRWALRIHRDGYHSRTAIQSELAWLTDLRQTGIVLTPVPVAGKDGEQIQRVGHEVEHEFRHRLHIGLEHAGRLREGRNLDGIVAKHEAQRVGIVHGDVEHHAATRFRFGDAPALQGLRQIDGMRQPQGPDAGKPLKPAKPTGQGSATEAYVFSQLHEILCRGTLKFFVNRSCARRGILP